MLVLWTLVLRSLLWPSIGCAHSVKDGCYVQDSLKFEDLLLEYVKFTAYTPRSGSVFKAKVTCEENWRSDSFIVSSNSVTMKGFSGTALENKWPAPQVEEGCKDFELRFGDSYELLDGRGQSWFIEGISPDCKVGEVEISEGQLARHCPKGGLKWEVKGEKCPSIPLFHSSKRDHTLNITMESRYSFSPVFQIGGTKVELGMREGSLVAAEEAMSPLEATVHKIRLCFWQLGENISFKLTTGEPLYKLLYMATLAREPRYMEVCDKNNGKFVITATLDQTRGDEGGKYGKGAVRNLDQKMRSDEGGKVFFVGYLFWCFFGGLIFAAALILCLAVGLCQLRHNNERNVRTPQQGKSAPDQQEQPDTCSPYLEPRVLPHRESARSDNSRSSPEHIYEEVDEAAFVPGFETYSSQDESSSAGSLA